MPADDPPRFCPWPEAAVCLDFHGWFQRVSRRGFGCQRPTVPSLMVGLCWLGLSGCGAGGHGDWQAPAMADCRFQTNGFVHLHIAEEQGTVSLISDYTPGQAPDHALDLREGRESEGRLVRGGDSRQLVEFFLVNDEFGQKPGETVLLRLAADGRSRIEARSPQGRIRTLDFGTCTAAPRPLDRKGH